MVDARIWTSNYQVDQSGEPCKQFEVREPNEKENSNIERSILIPKDLVETTIDDLDRKELFNSIATHFCCCNSWLISVRTIR